jgi:hypothetical protein
MFDVVPADTEGMQYATRIRISGEYQVRQIIFGLFNQLSDTFIRTDSVLGRQ